MLVAASLAGHEKRWSPRSYHAICNRVKSEIAAAYKHVRERVSAEYKRVGSTCAHAQGHRTWSEKRASLTLTAGDPPPAARAYCSRT
eukprot:scaffold44312_cov37-Tisochrysis_lutea.AAC.2